MLPKKHFALMLTASVLLTMLIQPHAALAEEDEVTDESIPEVEEPTDEEIIEEIEEVVEEELFEEKIITKFSDVSEGNAYYTAINYLQENSIINGYEDGTYKPYQEISRAESLKMLTLTSGIISEEELPTFEEDEKRPFTDTPLSEWYTPYLKAAKDKEIINGYEDGSFKPDQTINLAEMLKIFLESYENIEYPEITNYLYNDTPESEWFTKYTAYAGSENIINVYPSNTVSPEQPMTRGYMAEIMYRKIMRESGHMFGKATFYGAAVQGNLTASGEIFDMYQMTAAHKELAFGTIVEVTNLANGESIQVTITDRGPYGPGRVIDLTSSAFEEIAWLGTGVIFVEYKIVHLP